jgi:hypothetical protein
MLQRLADTGLVKGMPKLVVLLRAPDQQLGISGLAGNVA